MGLMTTAFNVGVGALGAAEFGTKGLITGAAIGLGTEAVSYGATKDEEDSVKKAAKAGFISGISQSAFSSMQELYAFSNPNSVQAISSLNSTTSISAEFDAIKTILNKDEWKRSWRQAGSGLKEIERLTGKSSGTVAQILATPNIMATKYGATSMRPENFVVDIARSAQIKNQSMGEDIGEIVSSMQKRMMATAGIPTNLADVSDDSIDALSNIVKNSPNEHVESLFKRAGMDLDRVNEIEGNPLFDIIKKNAGIDWSLELAPDSVIDKLRDVLSNEEVVSNIKTGVSKAQRIAGVKPKTKSKKIIEGIADGVTGFAKAQYDTIAETVKLGDGKVQSPWVNNVASDIAEDKASLLGKDYNLKATKLDVLDDASERTAKMIERNSGMVDDTIDLYNSISKEALKGGTAGAKIQNAAEMADYVRGIQPGAYGTYKELQRIGVYGENSSIVDKTIGLVLENKSGSPLWSRVLDKQLNGGKQGNATASIEKSVDILDEAGKVIKNVSTDAFDPKKLKAGHSVNVKNTIKGKGKLARGLALAGDIAIGGVATGALFAAPALLTKPFSNSNKENNSGDKPLKRGGKDLSTNNIKSNSPVNPVY